MSVFRRWLTGEPEQQYEDNEEEQQSPAVLRAQTSSAQSELVRLRAENEQLRARVDSARRIIENGRSIMESRMTPDTDKYEREIETLKSSHEEALKQLDAEHAERMEAEKQRDIAAVKLERSRMEAQHAKGALSVYMKRAEMATQAEEDVSATALKVEAEKDAELVSAEKELNDINAKLNSMKMEQLTLRRELAACAFRAGETRGDFRNLHEYAMDVVKNFEDK
jgi:hypothetical protein